MTHPATYIVQHQRATHDTNGNPRQLWVIYQDCSTDPTRYARLHRVVDAGYGISTAAKAMKAVGLNDTAHLILPAVDITPIEYREGLRIAESTNPDLPWRVRWVDDGIDGEAFCYAASRSRARKVADEYNRPYRNTERPIRVVAEPNV